MLTDNMEVFLKELEEQLRLMDEYILMLERDGRTDEVVQNLYRAAHILKGSSAAMGIDPIKHLTRHMEHLLDQVRSSKRAVTPALIALLFKTLDGLKRLKSELSGTGGITSDITPYIQDLQAFQARSPIAGHPAAGALDMHAEARPELSLPIRRQVRELLEKGKHVYFLHFHITPECLILGARAYIIQSRLAEWGEVLQAFPDPETLDERETHAPLITFLYAGPQEEEEIRALAAALVDVEAVQAEPVFREEMKISSATADDAGRPSSEEWGRQAKSKSQTICVSVEWLDHLMNLVGELVIDQTRIRQVERTQRRRFQDDTVSELGHISDHLARIISDLQESVMKARMLPIEQCAAKSRS